MLTTLSMTAALVMLAAVVVAKIITVELLAAHHRRYNRLLEQLAETRSDLRGALNQHAVVEREWRRAENKRHRLNLRIARAHEEIGLFEFDQSCRRAHFDLLTQHLVER